MLKKIQQALKFTRNHVVTPVAQAFSFINREAVSPVIDKAIVPVAEEISSAFSGESAEIEGGERPLAPDMLRRFRWTEVPSVVRHHERLMAGGTQDRYRHFLHYATSRWGGKLPTSGMNVMVLGLVDMPPLEQYLLEIDEISSITVIHNIDGVTKPQNLPDSIRYEKLDINHDPLPYGPFHLTVSYEQLHRIGEPEMVLERISDSMELGGLFVAREYTGPNRLQFTDQQMELVNALLPLIPEHLRLDVSGTAKERQDALQLAEVMERDPTVAIRSADILDAVKARFRIIEEVPLGGTVLAPLLAGIANHFVRGDADTEQIMEALIQLESQLIAAEMLLSDYHFIVGRKG